MIVTPMPSFIEPEVRKLHAESHPEWPVPPVSFFYAYPTIVAIETSKSGPTALLGYAQYSINTDTKGYLALFLQDTGIAPAAKGKGIGKALMQERLRIGRDMDCTIALGVTQSDNVAMLKILKGAGFEERSTVPGFYHQYTPAKNGVIFIRDLTKD